MLNNLTKMGSLVERYPNVKIRWKSKQKVNKGLNNRQQQVNNSSVHFKSPNPADTCRPDAQCSPTNHPYIKTSLCWLTAAKIPVGPHCHKSSAVAAPGKWAFSFRNVRALLSLVVKMVVDFGNGKKEVEMVEPGRWEDWMCQAWWKSACLWVKH